MPAQTGGKKVQGTKRPKAAPQQAGRKPNAASVSIEARVNMRTRVRLIIEELRKVVWPSWDELVRMTGIVIATVVIFAALIGTTDYALAFVVGKVYGSHASTTSGSNNTNTVNTQPAPTATP